MSIKNAIGLKNRGPKKSRGRRNGVFDDFFQKFLIMGFMMFWEIWENGECPIIGFNEFLMGVGSSLRYPQLNPHLTALMMSMVVLRSYPGSPPASILLASVTSFDQTSYCHFRRPRTPQRTRPVWMPTRMFSWTSVASTTELKMKWRQQLLQNSIIYKTLLRCFKYVLLSYIWKNCLWKFVFH